MIHAHYAIQTCDISVRDNREPRYASDSKTEILKKCVTSFLISVKTLENTVSDIMQHVAIFDDHSTTETLEFLKRVKHQFSSDRLEIEIISLPTRGLFESVRACFDWLEKNGIDIVYQVQDDYLFEPNALYEMIGVFMKVFNDTKTHAVVTPYNHPHYHTSVYAYQSIPRVIVPGGNRYWVQHYEIPCTFLTSKVEFSKHWDLYENFFNGDLFDSKLEINSFNKIITEHNVLGIQPLTSVALHMQTEFDKDPYIDWKSWWDRVPNI